MDRAGILYEIRIQGCLDEGWNGCFEGVTIDRDHAGETIISGRVVDQAALHGLLDLILSLQLKLISVRQIPVKNELRGSVPGED